MKSTGANFEYEKERNEDLLRAYRMEIDRCERIGIDVWRKIAESPSMRFWVSEERAAIVIARVIKGDTLSYMRPLRREMFLEIYRRVLDIKSVRQELSLRACCAKAVCTPAPKFYMTPLSVRQTIYKIKRKCLEEAKKRRRFFF